MKPTLPSAPWALAGLSLSMLMASLDTSIANAGLPALAQAFRASFQEAQWIVLAYLLAVTTLIVSAGRLGDLTGRRRLFLGGICLFTGASLFCGWAPTLWLLIAARAAQGLGAAIMMALAVAFVGETVPKARTGSAMGLLGTMSAIGTTLGPTLGGILIAEVGWRTIFFVNVPLGIANVLLALRYLPPDRRGLKTERAGFDGAGTLLLAITLAAYALAMTMGRGSFGSLNAALLLAALVCAGAFVFAERRVASPLLRIAMFRDQTLRAGLSMNAIVSTVLMGTLVIGPFYLSRSLGLRPVLVGLVMSVGPCVAALGGVPAGRIVDRFGACNTALIGLAAVAAGSLMLAMMPAAFGVPGYIAPIAIVTSGYALFQAANNTTVMTAADPGERGVVSGMLSLSRNLGLITGTSAMGALFALAGMRITFSAAALLVVAAIVFALARRALTPAMCASAASVVAVVLLCANVAYADPYPLPAAGWGPSSWADDWEDAVPAERKASLKLHAEARLRYDTYNNGQLTRGNRYSQGLFRGVFGAELRFNPNVRIFGEIGTGQVAGRRGLATPNFQNDASLQQLFAEARVHIGSSLAGIMAGRQEFADGPRQLLSVSDGPNMHRTWNGVRVYAHARRIRAGVFDLRATRLEHGFFDESVNGAERLAGINASLIVAPGPHGTNVYFDPFWIHSENATFRSGQTYGARVWGKRGAFTFDWTYARQTGRFLTRNTNAWGTFAVGRVTLNDRGWAPQVTAHVDIASSGFNQLYASSNYLGEGQFLSLSNLLMIAPGISVSPMRRLNLGIEDGFARRLDATDAVYAGGMRAYAGTQRVPGHEIGSLLRLTANYSASQHLGLFLNYEQVKAGDVLGRARFPSGSYGYIGATLRY